MHVLNRAHAQGAVLLAAAAGQRREADHEEVQPREGNQVHRQLAKVGVQLPCAQQPLSASPLLIHGTCTAPSRADVAGTVTAAVSSAVLHTATHAGEHACGSSMF